MIEKIETVQEFQWIIQTYFGTTYKVEEHSEYFLAKNENFTISLMLDKDYHPNIEKGWCFSTCPNCIKENLTFDSLYQEWKNNLN